MNTPDHVLVERERMNRVFFGDPYSDHPKFQPLWAGKPEDCPHKLRIRTAHEIRNNIP
jgi:hypothetical protein